MELWQGRPVVTGADPLVQRVIDSAFFYLHSSIHPCSPCSITPFGLSRTERYYNGHIFVDNEAKMFQVLLLTAPDAAKASRDPPSDR
jgi:trehalose/maltose hydrolase-like predicted phosphorylase